MFPSREFTFFLVLCLVSPSGTIPPAQPISEENVLAVTFSAGRAHHDPVCIKGEDKIVYFITRLNISLGVLDYVLKDTDREDKGQQKVLLPLRFASEFNSALLSRVSFEYTVH